MRPRPDALAVDLDPVAPRTPRGPATARPPRPRHVAGSPGPALGSAVAAWQRDRAAAWLQLVVVMILVGLAVILGRVVQLQTMPPEPITDAIQARRSLRVEHGFRGAILDRAGRPVATTTPGWRVFVDPQAAPEDELPTIAFDLAPLLDADPVTLDRRLQEAMARRPGTRFVPLTDPLPLERVARVRAARARGELRGVGLEPRPIRVRHAPGLATALVGTAGFDDTGLSGLEQAWNPMLDGRDGHVRYRRSRSGRELWIAPGDHVPPRDGAEIRLSIDLVVQRIAEDALRRAVGSVNAQGGRIVVADPRTGELLAAFDMLQHRTDPETIFAGHRARLDPNAPPLVARTSRLVAEPYEPGSTFKPFVWAILTEDGHARPDERLDTPAGPPGQRFGRRIVRDAYYYGPSDWRTVLVKSMNSGMGIVAERASHERLRDRVRDFGFGEPTRIGLFAESPGTVRPPAQWTKYTQVSVSMGHEIAVTPLQMVRAFMAFCRDGTIPALTLLAADEPVPGAAAGGAVASRRVVAPETARLVRDVLHEVTTEGTGRRARSDRWTSFGKSGTAQLPNPVAGGFFEDRYVSSYIAGAPLEDPRVVVLVVIDDPDRRIEHYGGRVAGPVAKEVFEAVLHHYGVPPDAPEATGGDEGEPAATARPAAPSLVRADAD